jgi:hypothetical protein
MSTGGGLFQPSRADGRSDWRVIFDLVEHLKPGEEVGHDVLLAELETTDRSRLYRAVQRANRELWSTRSRSLGVVKGVGYRMLRAEEHEAQANSYQRQARRRISNAVAVVEATDLSQLSADQREWMVKVQSGIHLLAQAMDSHARQLATHDEMIRRLQSGHDEEIRRLRSRVDRLEGGHG